MSRAVNLAPVALLSAAVGFGLFGAVLLVYPQLLELAGVRAVSNAGTIELRAFYGGLELGLAAFFFTAARRPEWVRPALCAQAASAGGIVAARIAALFLAGGEANVVIYASGAGEAVVALLALGALRQKQ